MRLEQIPRTRTAAVVLCLIATAFFIYPAGAVNAGVSVGPAEINISNATTTLDIAFEEGNWPRTAAYAELITKNDPTGGAEIWYKWAYALRMMGVYNESLNVADEAILRDPDNHLNYLNKGYVYIALGNWLEARKCAESALSKKPMEAAAYNIIALGLLGQGDEKNALIAAEQAASLAPDNALYLNTKGMILMKSGEYGKAVAVLTDAVESSEDGYDLPYPGAPTPEQNLNEAQRLYNETSVSPTMIFAAAGLILVVAAGAGLLRRRIRK